MKIAVIAGTYVDTKMGVEFLKSKGVQAVGYPVSVSPEEQSRLQILSSAELTYNIKNIIDKIKSENIDKIIIYCNSLSVAVDMDKLSDEKNIKIITPLHVYKNIASKHNSIGILAANNKSVAGIEKVIQSVNSNCNVIGVGMLPLVVGIERKESPKTLIQKFSLKNIIEFYNNIDVEMIILGCTHFSYMHDELKKYTSIHILDPAEEMYKMII